MGSLSSTRFAVAAFLVAAVMEATNPAAAQSFNELHEQRAARQAQAEWRRVLPAEIACIDQRLRRKGSSVEALIRRGVKPSATRLIELRSSCRDFVGGVHTDTAPALTGDATGPPTPTVSQGNLNEPKDAGVMPSAESLKDSSATPPSSEKTVGQLAEEQVKQGDVEPKNGVQSGKMEWLSAVFLFALVAIATLLGIVMYLFIRWRNTGQRTATVSLAGKNSERAGNTPLDATIAEAGKAVPPLADKEIQQPNQIRSAEATMSQDSAQSSNSQPTYGELFPEIVSMKLRNSG
jgi:hypothetical protein